MKATIYLLDTSVVLALVRGDKLGQHIDAHYQLRSAKTRPLVSIVTHGEIRVIARRNSWGRKKLAALEKALENLVTVDLHHPLVIDAYVEIDIFSQKHPMGARNMGKNDLWIAACAKASGADLITTDQDFSHLAPSMLDVHVESA